MDIVRLFLFRVLIGCIFTGEALLDLENVDIISKCDVWLLDVSLPSISYIFDEPLFAWLSIKFK